MSPAPDDGPATRYQTHLADFRDRLDQHHSDVITLVVAVMDAHSRRYSKGALFRDIDGSPGRLKEAQKRERIERLKASGWKRERFDPSRCERLCERARAALSALKGGGINSLLDVAAMG